MKASASDVFLLNHLEVLRREVQSEGEVLVVPPAFYDSCFAV